MSESIPPKDVVKEEIEEPTTSSNAQTPSGTTDIAMKSPVESETEEAEEVEETEEISPSLQNFGGIDFRRKLKHEAYVTSGCGKNKEKIRTVETFWNTVWPALETKLGWTKVKGVAEEVGMIYFRPASGDREFSRLKDVLDLLKRGDPVVPEIGEIWASYETELERRRLMDDQTASKKKATDDMDFEKDVTASPSSTSLGTSSSTRRARASAGSKKLQESDTEERDQVKRANDLSWKEGGKSFPRRSSSVGSRYQVTYLPAAGTYQKASNPTSDQYCELVWDPQAAKSKGIDLDEAIDRLPHNIREEALLKLAEVDYDVERFKEAVESIVPTDGSDWSREQKEKFRDEVFRSRKDLAAVQKAMGIPMKTCLAYYLGYYKTSDDYRLLKTVCAEEHNARIEHIEHGFDACMICGDGGNLLICDGCEGEFHMECCSPALERVPDGHWECDDCVDRKFLSAREYLIRRTRLFEEERDNKRPKLGDDPRSNHIVYRPQEPVVAAVKKLANQITLALASCKARELSRTNAVKVEDVPKGNNGAEHD